MANDSVHAPGTPEAPGDPLRICIVAENASYSFGGEASLPLHYFLRLRARGIQTWLIVHSRTRQELEALSPGEQNRILYIPDRWYHKLIWRLSRSLPRRLSEASLGILMVMINQLIQRRLLRQIIRTHRINVVHQPIPVSPKAPSFIYGLGVPVVIGPMNGGMNYPLGFRGGESVLTRGIVRIGRLGARLVNGIIAGKRHASALLVANERTRLALPGRFTGSVIELCENGVDLSLWCGATMAEEGSSPRFVFIGRLVDWKRVDFILEALAQCPGFRLDVIGDGPMKAEWVAKAANLGIGDRVAWLGWLSQSECARRLSGATALLLPSIYECGGAVVLEAMACAVPVVAVAWGGPADYIDESCGILIAPSDESSIIQGFAAAQRRLAANPELRAELGGAGRKRVEMHFDWNAKIDRVLSIYRQIIGEHAA